MTRSAGKIVFEESVLIMMPSERPDR